MDLVGSAEFFVFNYSHYSEEVLVNKTKMVVIFVGIIDKELWWTLPDGLTHGHGQNWKKKKNNTSGEF